MEESDQWSQIPTRTTSHLSVMPLTGHVYAVLSALLEECVHVEKKNEMCMFVSVCVTVLTSNLQPRPARLLSSRTVLTN